jgi:hypothetical protein
MRRARPLGGPIGDLAEPPANGQYAVITIQVKGLKGSFDVNPLDVQYQAANGNT